MKKVLRFLAAAALLAPLPAAGQKPPVGTPPGPGFVWANLPGVGWGWVAPGLVGQAKQAKPASPAVPLSAVKVLGPEGRCGSGTVIACVDGDSFVLTCQHVCPEAAAAYTVDVGGKRLSAVRLAADADRDLALLRVSADLPVSRLADKPPAASSPVRTYGHPGGGACAPKAGVVTAAGGHVDKRSSLPLLGMELCGESGDSGAAVFDAGGNVCGVLVLRDVFGERSYAVPLEAVKQFVGKHVPKPTPTVYRVTLLTAPGRCAPCRAFGPVFDAWAKAHTRAGVEFAVVNVDENPATAAKYGIEAVPSVVIEANGRVLARFRGAPLESEVTRYLPAR